MFFLILLRQEFEHFFKKCFICMGFACIYLCMSVYYVCAAWWPRMLEELVGILELKVQAVVSWHADSKNRTLTFQKSGK